MQMQSVIYMSTILGDELTTASPSGEDEVVAVVAHLNQKQLGKAPHTFLQRWLQCLEFLRSVCHLPSAIPR